MFEQHKIIDTHLHLGYDPLMSTNHAALDSDISDSASQLIEYMNQNHIDQCMVMPGGDPSFPKDWDDSEKNEILSRAVKQYPNKLIGCAFLHPQLGKSIGIDYLEKLMDKFIHEYGLRGFKLFCARGYYYASDTAMLEPVMHKAAQENIPIVFHSTRLPREMPSLIAHSAKAFPKTKIVIAHGGGHDYVHETIIALNECENLYIDSSLLWEIDIKRIVSKCGAHKVMYGSDGPFLSPRVAQVKIDVCGFSDADLDLILHENAKRIWGFC